MKKHIYIITGLTVAAFVILLSLNASMNKPNKYKNGFDRVFVTDVVREIKRIDFKHDLNTICGVSGDTVFFSGMIAGEVYYMSLSNPKLDTINIGLQDIPKLQMGVFTTVDYPYIYILGGNAKCVIKGNLITKDHEVTMFNAGGAFSNGTVINPETFVMRVIDSNTLDAQFKRFDLGAQAVTTEDDLSILLGDAGFTHDGRLSYDAVTDRLYYVPFYSNNVTCFDPSLQLLYRCHTIDTNAHANVEVLRKDDAATLKKPTITVNGYSHAHGGNLYVKSNLRADNEEDEGVFGFAMIDQYDGNNGEYLQSLVLPDSKAKKLRQFCFLQDGKLLVLMDREIILYDMDKPSV